MRRAGISRVMVRTSLGLDFGGPGQASSSLSMLCKDSDQIGEGLIKEPHPACPWYRTAHVFTCGLRGSPWVLCFEQRG